MIIFNFPTKSMQFCAIKAFIKFKWIILMERKKKTIIILAAAAVSTTIEKRFLFDFHIICRSAGIFFSKKNDDSVQRYNSSDGDTTFDKWWIVDDFLRWSPHYTRVISTSFVQLYGSWRDSILIHILDKLYYYMNNNHSTFVLLLQKPQSFWCICNLVIHQLYQK